ncbi:hypothetical protein PoB_002158800 [Plakobranchus ocellatus]|uniref:Apple domain-containing protein n=1 Tax=Plakobranchus ocellatus TaxID=259542 RepID=A0AAV3ZKI5_9GAST|nr:hypothetical protein PoB_002158800 [Plakobranchus ocellatus]
MTWADDTVVATDMPWTKDFSDEEFKEMPQAFLYYLGAMSILPRSQTRLAACGNHKNLATEAHGVTAHGKKPTGFTSSLSVSRAPSYLECAVGCALDYRCRVAEFNTGNMTCMTLGHESSTAFIDNPQSLTFIRNGFS